MTLLVMSLVFSVCICISKGDDNPDKQATSIGSVLFTESDTMKDCWSTENIALLTSRMMLEDILPSKDVIVIKDSAFITDIVDYFRLVLEVVRKLTYGKTKHIMLLALTDTLGGYLNHYVIPIAKRAYYAGYIDFDSMDRLYQLFDEIKCFLRTNGNGWARPITEFSRKMDAQPLPLQSPAPKTDPCKGLILFDKTSDLTSKKCSLGIPMPFFDSKAHPCAIAIPFKTYSLRNIESKSASYVLVKFYMAATKCLAKRTADAKSITEFNSNFFSWIRSQVLPHLNDDKFYSAFGGILRIEETLARAGVAQLHNKEMGNYNIMPEQQVKEYSKETADEASKRKKSNFILIALLATIFIWFLLGSLFICYRIRAAKSRKDECYCGRPEPKPSNTSRSSKPSKSSSKMSKLSSKLFGDTSCDKSSKKPSNSSTGTSRSKKSSGRVSPSRSTCSGPSEASVQVYSEQNAPSEPNAGSEPVSLVHTRGSKHSLSSVGSARSTSSRSSRHTPKKTSKRSAESQRSASPGSASPASAGTSASKPRKEPSKKSSKSTTAGSKGRRQFLVGNRPKPMYPASCACHTSMTGKYRMTSSSEEQMRKKEKEPPLVFGYELETSSESTPRDIPTEDMVDYGAMSK